ncbi:hypothetical protein [Rhizobium bangladeshense]|uniref:hypothetical protein n=1 Tax=Rhizobium bangladeshense TaxID=1138189 RepID=UPI001C83F4AB|nr:hypothetical protein [Rhizobium bangladeshense]MBX4893565.1 hypothetical protein [Rhizobium bangladeshense]MBX4898915.1 hypothetical protein [Rhizobium bangladeshense]MBY3617011.1 hypothetical protein [Rhizobium bangladeshense]
MGSRHSDLAEPDKQFATSDTPSLSSDPSKIGLLIGWGTGILILGSLIGLVLRFGDIHLFVVTLQSTDPGCLAAALIVQTVTYFCAATIWL